MQPVGGMWLGRYAVLPVFASPGESSWQGEVLSGVILCVTQDRPSSQTSDRSSRKGRRRQRGRARSFGSDRQWAGCTPRSTEAMEPGAFGELPATTCWVFQGGCAGEQSTPEHVSLLQGGRRGVPGSPVAPSKRRRQARRELTQVGWFPLNRGGLLSLIAPRRPRPPWAFHCGEQLSLPGEGWGLGWASGVTLASYFSSLSLSFITGEPVLGSCNCCNESPQTPCLRKAHVYSLTLLESQSPELVPQS